MKAAPKTLANRPLALGMFALTLTASAFLAGGTDTAMAQTQQRVSTRRGNIPAPVVNNGTVVNNGSNGTIVIDPTAPSVPNVAVAAPPAIGDQWNDGIVEKLHRWDYAAAQSFADADPKRAISHYKSGLMEILDTASLDQHRLSWTFKMAERTLALVERLQALPPVDAERDINAILLVLKSSYHMIENYYYSLDIQFWIPYYMVCRGHWTNSSINYDLGQFEYILNQYSLSQVQWFKQNFVDITPDGVSPRFSARIFLGVLSHVARGLSLDLGTDPNSLNPNLFPLAYAQAARSFKGLADEIDQYLAGNGLYSNDERAVNATYNRLNMIIGLIGVKKK